jgi:hypothetical protein
MDSELHHAEKQASAIAHEYFWCVAGRHQACVERLQEISGAVPYQVWLSLCFEPLLFGLEFFGEYARKHYTAQEQELFVAELETATRWLISTTLFEPNDVNFPPSQTLPSVQPAPNPWVLTKGHERALAPFRRWCEVRQRQFRRRLDRKVFGRHFKKQTNPHSDSSRLFEELKTDLARDGYGCPETVLRVFARGVVSEAYRIRSGVQNGSFRCDGNALEAGSNSPGPDRARTG